MSMRITVGGDTVYCGMNLLKLSYFQSVRSPPSHLSKVFFVKGRGATGRREVFQQNVKEPEQIQATEVRPTMKEQTADTHRNKRKHAKQKESATKKRQTRHKHNQTKEERHQTKRRR